MIEVHNIENTSFKKMIVIMTTNITPSDMRRKL